MSIQADKRPISPTAATALSDATTVAEQREAGLRRVRSDLGVLQKDHIRKRIHQKNKECQINTNTSTKTTSSGIKYCSKTTRKKIITRYR